MKLSFIGLGAMGLPMAKALLDASYDIEAFDISTGQMNAFRALGGKIATSARYTATGADVLLLMVLNAEQVETLLFEQDCLAALADNATIIVLSTLPPTYIQDLTRRLDTFSISLIDAPVSGGV